MNVSQPGEQAQPAQQEIDKKYFDSNINNEVVSTEFDDKGVTIGLRRSQLDNSYAENKDIGSRVITEEGKKSLMSPSMGSVISDDSATFPNVSSCSVSGYEKESIELQCKEYLALNEHKIQAEDSIWFDHFPYIAERLIKYISVCEPCILKLIGNIKNQLHAYLKICFGAKGKKKSHMSTFTLSVLKYIVFNKNYCSLHILNKIIYSNTEKGRESGIPEEVYPQMSDKKGVDKFSKSLSLECNQVRKILIGILSEYYYWECCATIINKDFIKARKVIGNLNLFCLEHGDDARQIKIKLDLLSFHIEYGSGSNDSVRCLLKDITFCCHPQLIWNKSMIDLGLCRRYKELSRPLIGLATLLELKENLQCLSIKEKGFIFEMHEDLQDKIINMWDMFKKKTLECKDFITARNALFRMIGHKVCCAKPVCEDLQLKYMSELSENNILKPSVLDELCLRWCPRSSKGEALWNDINIIFRKCSLTENSVIINRQFQKEMKDRLGLAGISGELIDNLLKNKHEVNIIMAYLKYNYNFALNYIIWKRAVLEKLTSDDIPQNEEIESTKEIMSHLEGNIDELIESPMYPWLVNVASCQEWVKQSIVANFINDDTKKARLYGYMSEQSEIIRVGQVKTLDSIQNSDVSKGRSLTFTDDNHASNEFYCVIVAVIGFLMNDNKDEAVDVLLEYNEAVPSGVVECLLGDIKADQLVELQGSEFREKQKEAMIHYKKAGSLGIIYGKNKGDLFDKNRRFFLKSNKHRDKEDGIEKGKEVLISSELQSTPTSVVSLLDDINSEVVSNSSHNDNPQQHQAIPVLFEEEGARPKVKSTKILTKKECSSLVSSAFLKYSEATEYDDDIDFEKADKALNLLEDILDKRPEHISAHKKVRIKQSRSWYYYEMLKNSKRYEFSDATKNSYKKLLYHHLQEGFKICGIDVNIDNPEETIISLEDNNKIIKFTNKGEDFKIQMASLVSTCAHWFYYKKPNKKYHTKLYSLAEKINPAKKYSHQIPNTTNKVCMVKSFDFLRPK